MINTSTQGKEKLCSLSFRQSLVSSTRSNCRRDVFLSWPETETPHNIVPRQKISSCFFRTFLCLYFFKLWNSSQLLGGCCAQIHKVGFCLWVWEWSLGRIFYPIIFAQLLCCTTTPGAEGAGSMFPAVGNAAASWEGHDLWGKGRNSASNQDPGMK